MRARVVGAASGLLALVVGASPAYAVSAAPPPVNASVDYQLGGSYAPASGVAVVTRDVGSAPAPGTYGICYVNAFQTQPGTRSWWLAHHPSLLLRDRAGRLVTDPDWPDETLLDTSTSAKRRELLAVADIWLARCAAKGFRAVEPDNLDSWTRSRGRLTMRHNAGYAAALVAHAHARGLAVAQKNDVDMLRLRSTTRFDFAVVEECQVYAECGAFTAVYGDHVIEIEYADAGGRANFRSACAARGSRISIVYRDRDLVARGKPGYVFATC
jgi:hypothetical protein